MDDAAENEAVLDRMDARMAQRPDILQRRRETVEHPFGSIKQWMNQGAFSDAASAKCARRIQPDRARLQSSAVINIVEFPTLMAALQA